MSRTKQGWSSHFGEPTKFNRDFPTHRGVSKLKRYYASRTRRILDREMAKEEPLMEQPKKLRNFWWEWF